MGLIEYNGIYDIAILLTFFSFILKNVGGKTRAIVHQTRAHSKYAFSFLQ
jgi:hypothetical protein